MIVCPYRAPAPCAPLLRCSGVRAEDWMCANQASGEPKMVVASDWSIARRERACMTTMAVQHRNATAAACRAILMRCHSRASSRLPHRHTCLFVCFTTSCMHANRQNCPTTCNDQRWRRAAGGRSSTGGICCSPACGAARLPPKPAPGLPPGRSWTAVWPGWAVDGAPVLAS